MLMLLACAVGGSLSTAEPASAATSAVEGGGADGVDLLLAWEAASPLDDSPCRGYSHLYGLRLQVCSACRVRWAHM